MVRIRPSPEHLAAEEALAPILRALKYRPDWTFEVYHGELIVRATVVDADEPRKTIPLQFGIPLPLYVYPDFDWIRWLFDQIMIIERHEAQEFFQLDGVKVFDPHA